MTMASDYPAAPSWGRILGYSAGSVGAGVYSTVPGILLLYFMTQVLLLPVALASLAVLLPKLVVIAVDPLIGAWSDRTRSRWGRRRPFLLVGALLAAASFVLLFNAPALATEKATFALMIGVYLLATLSYSVFSVPYVSLPSEMADSPRIQSRIVGARMIGVFSGVLLGAAAPPLLVEALGGGAQGYGIMAAIIAGVSLTCMLVSILSVQERPAPLEVSTSQDILPLLKRIAAFSPFAWAFAIYIVIITGFGLKSAAAAYFVTYALGGGAAALSSFFTAQVATSLLTMAGWTWLASRLSYSRLLVAAAAIGAGGATMLYVCGPETPASLFIAGGIALGLASAGIQVGAFSLLADVIVRFRHQDGAAAEGLMTGVWVAGEKLGLAFGPVICGLILAAGGFVSGADRSVQTPEAIQAARVAMTLAPGLIIAAGGALLWIGRRRIDRQAAD